MTGPILLTGANGLIGSNVCEALLDEGLEVRVMLRPQSPLSWSPSREVEYVEGDVASSRDVLRAAKGSSAVIHSAALLGGANQALNELISVNELGSRWCYDAGRIEGVRVVALGTTSYFSSEEPLSELSKVLQENECTDDPYTITKARAYREGRQRSDEGQDIVFVLPGATYGPAPANARAMDKTSFNRTIRAAVRGRITSYVAFPLPWVFSRDVANVVVRSLLHGDAGSTYLAFGAESAMTTAEFLNVACEVAGSSNRVIDEVIDPQDVHALKRFGPSLLAMATRSWPQPFFNNDRTRESLDYSPISLRLGLHETLNWMRSTSLLD